MKAAIINPYLDTLGGGERYTISFASVLQQNGYSVDLQWGSPLIKQKLENRFGINLKNINIIPDAKKGDGYDICFWVSDGSIPLMQARRNILHFQVPFHNVDGRSLLNKMKLYRINKIVCNSGFTKKIIDKEFGINSIVIYPPIDTKVIRPKRKENIILYVGRFSNILQNKGQEILISAFKKLISNNNSSINNWRLILAGGVEIGATQLLTKLADISSGYPIEIIQSPDFEKLKDLYGKAKIFWSASGFGTDEQKYPEKMEHFGMTVVEAMSAGAVPLVVNGGGHKEIVIDDKNGYLWNTPSDLVNKTELLITNSKNLRNLEKASIKEALKYSSVNFENQILSNILCAKI